MEKTALITLLLIICNALFTYKGLNNTSLLNRYLLNVEQVLLKKDYKRIITSGFLHADWIHFSFNVFALYIFGNQLETAVGILPYICIYFASLIGGNLYTLFINKDDLVYSALGASSAISGVVFASIGLFPSMKIGLMFLPIYFPAWIYGIAYIIYSIYSMLLKKGTVAHEAHLGGALTGLITLILLKPMVINANYIAILLIFTLLTTFIYLSIKKPQMLVAVSPFSKEEKYRTVDDIYHDKKTAEQKELNNLLDKINKKGYEKLSKKEKARLDILSKN